MQILTIAGNIGKDAEIRRTQGGDPIASFSVAVDTGKDRDGNKRPAAWFDCSIWGKRAEALARYIRKGGKVTVSGRPTARAHEGKVYMGVNVDQITLQGGGQEAGTAQQGGAPAGGFDSSEIPFSPSVL